jgi:hypothetical protein
LAKNAKSDQTEVEFNLSSIGGWNESRVNAESQTAAPKNQETSRCRGQAGQTSGEAGVGGAGGVEGKGEKGKSEERKGQDGKSEKDQADERRAWQARCQEKQCGRRKKRRVLGFLDTEPGRSLRGTAPPLPG